MIATFVPGPAFQCLSGENKGDARAQQRRHPLDVEGLRDLEDEVLVDDDGLRVAPLWRAVDVDACVGLHVPLEVVDLFSLEALCSLTT